MHEESIEEKEAEIALLKARILSLTSGTNEASNDETPTAVDSIQLESSLCAVGSSASTARRGKAPPVEPYTGENPDILWEEWFPMFERAASWNGWTEQDRLLQLAGHLRGKALQE